MQTTLKVGIADGCVVIRLGDKEIFLEPDQGIDLFNAIGEALEAIGAFECDECPNKDKCDEFCEINEGDDSCVLH
jgi:hypothetical protein